MSSLIHAYTERFLSYVSEFVKDANGQSGRMELKRYHSLKVLEEMGSLADSIGLDEERKETALILALFHDIGRFKQLADYGTFSDERSRNHSLLGVEEIERTHMLKNLDAERRGLILKAIMNHNLIEIPSGGNDELVLFSRLIRDADKIDIYRVTLENYYTLGPDGEPIVKSEFPDTPVITPEIMAAVEKGEKVRYGALKTLNDFKLMQIAWVYDLHFPYSFKAVQKRSYIHRLIELLPDTRDVRHISEAVLSFMTARSAASEKTLSV